MEPCGFPMKPYRAPEPRGIPRDVQESERTQNAVPVPKELEGALGSRRAPLRAARHFINAEKILNIPVDGRKRMFLSMHCLPENTLANSQILLQKQIKYIIKLIRTEMNVNQVTMINTYLYLLYLSNKLGVPFTCKLL